MEKPENDVEKKINNIIDDFLSREDKQKTDNIHYPSEIPYCYRKNYYSRRSPIPFTKDTKRIFQVGNIFHNFITLILKKSFEMRLTDSERSVTIIADAENDIDIRGRLDNLVIVNPEETGEELSIFEVKSSANISKMKKAQSHHILQLQPYLRALQLKHGHIVYVEKNTLQVKVFEVPYDKEIFLKVVARAKHLGNYLKLNKLPEPEGKIIKDWQCGYCDYKEMCDLNYNPPEDGDFKEFKERKNKPDKF
jgi:CRISPR-associated exonuclease Cas4